MDESSSGFRDESPVLFKQPSNSAEPNDVIKLSLDELYKDVLLYLKKSKKLTQIELKSFMEQVTAMTPTCQRDKWIIQKTKGLLKFILKKKAEFQDCVVKGDIIIYEKSYNDKTVSLSNTPLYSNNEFPLSILSNNNFELMDMNYNHKSTKTDSYNYSQDLFTDTTQIIHTYARKNYQIFKDLARQNQDANTLFKVSRIAGPKIDNFHKIHESLEENYNSIVSLTSSLFVHPAEVELMKAANNSAAEMVSVNEMQPILQIEDEYLDGTIFDDVVEIHQDFWKDEFQKESEKIEGHIQEIVSKMQSLEVRELCKIPKLFTNERTFNKSIDSIGNTQLQPYHSEENLKIIREACWKFRKNLESKADIDFLRDFLNNS